MKNTCKKSLFYLIPIMLLFVALISISGNTVWSDEAFSMNLVQHSFLDIIRLDAKDVHPPLYYLILGLFIKIFGPIANDIVLGKIVSLIPYIILIIVGFIYIRNEYGELEAFFFNIFILGMPQMMAYSIEIRMYSWGMLFVTLAFLQVKHILKDDNGKDDYINNYILLSLFSALSLYTHYFAGVSCIVIYAELLIISLIKRNYNKLFKTFLSGIGVVAVYIPWLFVFVRQLSEVKEDFWIPPINSEEIIKIVLFLFNHDFVPAGFILALFIAALIEAIYLIIRKNEIIPLLGILVWFGTLLIGIILSYAIRPIFLPRYLMCSAACIWLGVSIALSHFNFWKIKNYYFIPVVLIISFLICGKLYKYEEWLNRISNEAKLKLDNYIADKPTIIISDDVQIYTVMSYLYPDETILSFDKFKTVDDKNDYNVLVISLDEKEVNEFKNDGYELTFLEHMRYDCYEYNTYLIPRE